MIQAQTRKLTVEDDDSEDTIIIVNDWEDSNAESCESFGSGDTEI